MTQNREMKKLPVSAAKELALGVSGAGAFVDALVQRTPAAKPLGNGDTIRKAWRSVGGHLKRAEAAVIQDSNGKRIVRNPTVRVVRMCDRAKNQNKSLVTVKLPDDGRKFD